jgi:uncharacterized protein
MYMKRLIFSTILAAGFLSLGGFIPAESQTAPTSIRLCTGADGGVYNQVGNIIASFSSKTPIEVIETGGTYDNMARMLDTGPEGCDAMIGQPDGPVFMKRTKPGDAAKMSKMMPLHREYLHVLCSKESGITDLDQLSKDNKVAIGAEGSGAWLIWQNFIEQDSGYADIPVTQDSGITALTAVASNETTCMLAPSGVPNAAVSEADGSYGDAVILAGATDKDMNDAQDIDGKPLYTFTKLPLDKYPVTFGNCTFCSIKTISWNAAIYVNKSKLNGKNLEAFLKAATRSRNQILTTFGK